RWKMRSSSSAYVTGDVYHEPGSVRAPCVGMSVARKNVLTRILRRHQRVTLQCAPTSVVAATGSARLLHPLDYGEPALPLFLALRTHASHRHHDLAFPRGTRRRVVGRAHRTRWRRDHRSAAHDS